MIKNVDLVVVGGGTAGVAAAVSAARSGARVVLLERYGFLGGMATAARVGTICGLYLRDPHSTEAHFALSGLPQDFAQEFRETSSSAPQKFAEGLFCLPYECSLLRVFLDDYVARADVEVRHHCQVSSVKQREVGGFRLAGLWWNTPFALETKALVDCTGEAVVCLLSGATTREPSRGQAMSAVFDLVGVQFESADQLRLQLIREVIRGVQSGALPSECERVSLVPGSFTGSRVSLKLGIAGSKCATPEVLSRLERDTRGHVFTLSQYLCQSVEGFQGSKLTNFYSQLGIRVGKTALGEKVLTRSHVMGATKFWDGVAAGAWPIERWDSHKQPTLEYFAENEFYEIPAGCLRSKDLSGLYFAGRHISADEDALASARVIATCLSTGFAAGALAAGFAQGLDEQSVISKIREDQGLATHSHMERGSEHVFV